MAAASPVHGAYQQRHMGEFQCLSKLGRGGYGQVIHAYNHEKRRYCALKLFNLSAAVPADKKVDLAKVEKEIQARVV
jgi:hypothetical protein